MLNAEEVMEKAVDLHDRTSSPQSAPEKHRPRLWKTLTSKPTERDHEIKQLAVISRQNRA